MMFFVSLQVRKQRANLFRLFYIRKKADEEMKRKKRIIVLNKGVSNVLLRYN